MASNELTTLLDPAARDSLVRKLELRAAELRSQIAADQEATLVRAMTRTEVFDRKDEAEAAQEAGVRSGELERDRAELATVQAALARVGQGRYGICPDCDNEIDAARLAAQPEALRCAPCQRRFEQRLRRWA